MELLKRHLKKKIMRKKRLALNILINLSYQVLAIVSGFIIPRVILSHFGSSVNGLVNSITQFLGVITLLECGVTSVIDANLYEPLAKKDYPQISRIFVSTQLFFRNLTKIFLVYLVILTIFYPFSVMDKFGYFYSMSLIVIISLSTFIQYYYGLTYITLLNADQKSYIVKFIQCITIVLNTVISYVLIRLDFSIHLVKIVSPIVFIIQPICLKYYVERYYTLNKKIDIKEEPIKQKWNGLAQHIAFVVTTKADTVILTLFSSLENVSIYGVYNLINTGVDSLLGIMSYGIAPLIGNMLANKESDLLNTFFDVYEWMSHVIITLVFTMTGVLIIPFVKIYTKGINDADYIVPLFGYIITAANAMKTLRTPYSSVVFSAGHFRQTQTSSIIESCINIIISVICVFKFGLIGVAIGTLIAMGYRTIFLVWYLSKNIIYRKMYIFWRHIAIDIATIAAIILISENIIMEVESYLEWILLSFKIMIPCMFLSAGINVMFNRSNIIKVISYIKGSKRKL